MDIILFIIESLKNPIIIVCVVAMILTVICFRKILHQQVNALASIVTVIGVLGTFVGIAWGLLNFDTNDVEASVPKLLEGLKAAFVTSILGIGGSIALKWLTLSEQKKRHESTETYTGATVDDLANLLKKILEVEQIEGKETRESLQSIEKSLTGEGDSTVLTQLQKLRTTFLDKQDDLVRAFNEFAARMAENNTQALIEALEEVMRDFNAKINEQFGDNFRQLNEAVGRINDWQEQYRQQMNQLAEEFRIAAESVGESRRSLEVIADRSGAIVSSAEQLDPILQALQQQIGRLDTNLEAFSALAENARDAFPIIENRLNQLTDDFSTVVQETIDNSHASMQSQRAAVDNFSNQVRESIDNSHADMVRQREAFQNFTARVQTVIQNTSEGLESTIKETNQSLKNTVQDQSSHLSTETQRIFRDSTNLMTQRIQALDESLGEELTKALNSLGNQLTSLSSKFVTDYTPLTEQLHNVVQIAKGLESSNSRRRQ